LAAIIGILLTPLPDDDLGQKVFALALLAWGIGSISSSIDSFFNTELSIASEVAYSLFYPLAIFGAIRSLRNQAKSRRLELIDTLVIALSGTTLLSTLFLKPAATEITGSQYEVFLTIIYPVGDLVLLLTVIGIVLLQRLSPRNLFFLLGVTIFTASDFYYLWLSQNDLYVFGSLSDAGWLLGFVLIANSYWFPSDEEEHPRSFNPTIVTLALVLSSIILAISVLRPDYFPRFVLIPAFATIALAFLRMAVAMSDARKMSEEQILARTDELTGLANRRRFISEFEEFQKSPGSLLILDLDGFKPVNDQLGHEVGDQLLAQVARRLERVMPHGALLARLGGDEFGALVPGYDGMEVAVALRATLEFPFNVAGHEIKLGVSVGEAFSESESDSQNLLRRADEAMYRAKREKVGVARAR
jgi:diguanylate cyclase (GGDEF)-like protein